MFEHDHLIAPRLVFARQKCSAEFRLDAEGIEEAGGDAITSESFRLTRARQIEGAMNYGDEPLEALVLRMPIIEIAGRDRAVVEAAIQGALLPNHHQAFLMREIERAQNQCVRHAEYRRIRRDPRRQSDEGD